jgi:hypothetical protein
MFLFPSKSFLLIKMAQQFSDSMIEKRLSIASSVSKQALADHGN